MLIVVQLQCTLGRLQVGQVKEREIRPKDARNRDIDGQMDGF